MQSLVCKTILVSLQSHHASVVITSKTTQVGCSTYHPRQGIGCKNAIAVISTKSKGNTTFAPHSDFFVYSWTLQHEAV